MEYVKKKEEILAGVQYQNLLSFNLVENKLERNFRSIVDALMLNQENTSGLRGDFESLKNQHSNQIQKLKDRLKQLQNNQLKTERDLGRLNQINNSENKKEESNASDKNSAQLIKAIEEKPQQSYVDERELQKLREEIEKIKRQMPSGDYLEGLIKQAQKDISGIKGQLLTLNQQTHKSSLKSLKRASIVKDIKQDAPIVQNTTKTNQSIRKESTKIISSKDNKENNRNEKKQTQSRHQSRENLEQRMDTEEHEENSNDKAIDGSELLDKIEKQFNIFHIELNTIKLGLEELRQAAGDLKKKEIKHTNELRDLNDLHKKMEKQSIADHENFDKQLKAIQMELINLQTAPAKQQEGQSKQKTIVGANTSNNSTGENPNSKNQINDKFSKLQAMLQGCVTESEFSRFKGETRDKLEGIDKAMEQVKENMDEEVRKLYQMIDSIKNSDIDDIKKQLDNMKEQADEKALQWERKNNIALSKIEELKKALQNLREDVEFYQSMHTNSEQKQSQIVNQVESQKEPNAKGYDSKELEGLKRSLNNKIQDQRIYLLGLIRDLERKLSPKGSVEQDIVGIVDRISELNLFLNKKADSEDIKKNLAYLEKRLNMIANHLAKSDEDNEDARVAKTNWFCLSCDKNLHNYTGKVGRHVVWDYIPMKNQTKFVKEQVKKSLPTLKRNL